MNQHQKLIQLLEAETGLVDGLMESLEQESLSLENNDNAQLESIVARKRVQVEQLEAIGRERKSMLDSMLGVDSAACDVAEMFRNDKQVTTLWQQLTEKAQACRDRNLANGTVIDAISRQTSQALDILRGKQNPALSPANLYDHKGQTVASAGKHSLTQV